MHHAPQVVNLHICLPKPHRIQLRSSDIATLVEATIFPPLLCGQDVCNVSKETCVFACEQLTELCLARSIFLKREERFDTPAAVRLDDFESILWRANTRV